MLQATFVEIQFSIKGAVQIRDFRNHEAKQQAVVELLRLRGRHGVRQNGTNIRRRHAGLGDVPQDLLLAQQQCRNARDNHEDAYSDPAHKGITGKQIGDSASTSPDRPSGASPDGKKEGPGSNRPRCESHAGALATLRTN